MITNNSWRFLQAYLDYFQEVPPFVLDFLAIEEIIKYCISGISNKTIALSLDISEELIKDILEKFLEFSGWEEDLDISPMFFYNSSYGIYLLYRNKIEEVSPVTTEEIILQSYRVCHTYQNLLQKMRIKYEYD